MEQLPEHTAEWLAFEGEAGRAARGVDWQSTALGPTAGWSEALKAAAASCLGSQWPTIVMWGTELVCIYNDAYREIIMRKHPWAMGRCAAEVFAEMWEGLKPLLERVMTDGVAVRYADYRLDIERQGFLEEAYFTLSVNPVIGTKGAVEGVSLPVHETTRKVLSGRRLDTLRDLLGATKEDEAPEEVCQWAARALAENRGDIPCALIYLNDGAGSGLAAAAGMPLPVMDQISKVPVAEERLRRQAELRHGEELEQVATILPTEAKSNGWEGWNYRSRVIPLVTLEQSRPSGYLVAALSPRLPFDGEYRDFLELIGAQVGRMIAGGRAVEEARIIEALLRFDRSAGPHLDGIMQTLTNEAQRLCNADFAAFFATRDGAQGGEVPGLKASVVTGVPPPGWEGMVAEFLAAAGAHAQIAGKYAERSGQAIGTRATGTKDGAERETVHSWLVRPVASASGGVHGSVVLGKSEANQFGPRQERLLAGLLAHGAIAIDNAKLLTAERASRQRLGRALAIRDNFLSIASHELRNPLNSLHLRLNILKREIDALTAMEDAGRRLGGHVEKASGQITRMTQLLDRLLDISRIASGRLLLEPREYDMAAQIEQVAERFSEQAAPGQIQVTAAGPVSGRWDEVRAEQVFTNLLSNAVKYGEGKPIQISLRTIDDMVEVEVVDHGIGIATEDQSRVFEQFERVESEQARGGFGLGLWISRQIVAAMGGEMRLQSKRGEGAAFIVRLPRRVSMMRG